MGADHDAYFEEVEARFDERARPRPRSRGGVPGPRPRDARARPAPSRRCATRRRRACVSASPASCSPRRSRSARRAAPLRAGGEAAPAQRGAELFAHADGQGYALGSTATHPFSGWKDQRIIDTPHYRLVEDRLKYVAWRNNTWAAHVHVGVRGCDKAVAVCDALRTYLPHLLALSANSPFIEDVWTQLHSARTQTFVRMFPRCGIPDVFGTGRRTGASPRSSSTPTASGVHAGLVVRCGRTTRFGTVEVRICDAQTEALAEPGDRRRSPSGSSPLCGTSCTTRTMPLPILETRYIEENLWRAIRCGLDGELVAGRRGKELPARRRHPAPRRPGRTVRRRLGAAGSPTSSACSQRQRRAASGRRAPIRGGATSREVFAGTVEARAPPAPSRRRARREESEIGQ